MEKFSALIMTALPATSKEQSEYFTIELPEYFTETASPEDQEQVRDLIKELYQVIYYTMGQSPILVDGKFDKTENQFPTSK